MPDDVPGRLEAVERQMGANSREIAQNSREIAQLKIDMGEIRAYLGQTATKADLAEWGAKIHGAINEILRDALNAMPVKQSAIWGAVVGIATIGLMLIALLPR